MIKFLMNLIAMRFCADPKHMMDDFMFPTAGGAWAERKACQILQPGFPVDDPPPLAPHVVPPIPTDVPVPDPYDVPVPDPTDVPPPDPRDVPPPKPTSPKIDRKPRSVP